MNCIAIDTSGKHLTVIIIKEGKVCRYFDESCGVNHSVELMQRVEQLAEKAEFDFFSADFFACVVGAGSFTGIRIGVATVKALCFAYKKPCLSITSFETLAYNKQRNKKTLAVIDAGHNGFYVCGIQNYKTVLSPRYVLRDELVELLKEYDGVSGEKISGIKTKTVSVEDGLQKALTVKAEEKTFDLTKIEPLYVRKSQAEEGRP